MALLQPSSCSCFQLKLPRLEPSPNGTLDESTRRKLTLDCRTGAAVEIARSNIFVHGGLTIPLNLSHVNSVAIQKELILYFSKEKINGTEFKKLDDWISSETFFLDLVSRVWRRVEVNFESDEDDGSKTSSGSETDRTAYRDSNQGNRSSNDANSEQGDDRSKNKNDKDDDDLMVPVFKERLYHSMCFAESSLYIFGGLVVSPQSGYELIATNELWKLDLKTKKWSLINKDPQITRRFTHSMHTINRDSEEDTKLVIVGGLNNIDEPIHHIDIFNITKGSWETESNSSKIIANVENRKFPLVNESNFSILIENNEARIPTLALYSPKDQTSSNNTTDEYEATPEKSSPIVALPLIQDAQGMRMISKRSISDLISNGSSKYCEIPYNLQFPTGDYFGYTIIIAGFYPNSESSNFRCFVYDTSTQQWTILGITCHDGDYNRHRFWKLLAWQSHHQTLLLGTQTDDFNLPSVQKFDFILSFGLPMISIYNKTWHSVKHQRVVLTSPADQNPQSSRASSLAPETLEPNDSEAQPFRKPSFASTATSQFESYIRYIAPPLEMTSIRTVFPPYAMVLGKDALEIFGNPLSDFEFITDEGDSIGVPLYLLRKRWGRYFDMVLSQGYARACAEYENRGQSSDIMKFSPHSSQGVFPLKSSDLLSRGSLDTFSNRNRSNQGDLEDPHTIPPRNADFQEAELTDNHISNIMNAEINSNQPFYENVEEDPVSPPSRPQVDTLGSVRRSRSIHRGGAISTTSSSGGMVFRVPFQENVPAALSDTALSKKEDHEEKRRSSSVATAALNNLRTSIPADSWRRASRPNPSLSGPDGAHSNYSTSRYLSPSARNSRRGSSIASHSSSISYVSSSSDRMGNSVFPGSRKGSSVGPPFLGMLNIGLPPQEPMPNEALPPVPPEFAANRKNSFAEFVYTHSSKSSPFSSRRPSHDERSSSSDLKRPTDQYQSPLGKHIMNESQVLDSPLDFAAFQQKPFFSKIVHRSADSGINFTGKPPKSSDINRLSLDSNPESSNSMNSVLAEWEPLLTPRTLYMPWPTATVRAFAEFFFTGQVNGKWMLAPVVLNLLIMSKIYEIPLLYNLITEVLYSIIGRKEDSLYVICDSLIEAFRTKVLRFSSDDHEATQSYLEKNETFRELLKLKQSLENIDNGFFDVDLVKKVSRAFSASTNSDSAREKSSLGGSGGTSLAATSAIPTVFAGGPRNSHNSFGSIGYPSTFKQSTTAFPRRENNKSSLSKEINSATGTEVKFKTSEFSDLAEDIKDRENAPAPEGQPTELYLGDSRSVHSDTSSETSSSSDQTTEEEYEDATRDGASYYDTSFQSAIIDARTEMDSDDLPDGEEPGKKFDKILDELHIMSQKNRSEAESGSSMSDSDGLNSNIGLLSLNKMKRKIAGQDDPDESIDPLLKIGTSIQPLDRECQSQGRNSNTRSARDDSTPYELSTPTLENLASPNALPPVDYVIKSIYRSAALVNYPRLMVRCLDCIEISKRLRSLKKKIASELVGIEEEIGKPGSLSHELFRRKLLEKQKSDSALTKCMSTRPISVTKRSAPLVDTLPRVPDSDAQQEISPATSVNKDTESSKSLVSASPSVSGQQLRSIKNKFFGDPLTPPSNTAVLMNPAFMPPPPSSNKARKTNAGQPTGTFSFFNKKK